MTDAQTIYSIYVVGLILLGLVECFLGYRILRFFLAASGFILGAVLAAIAAYNYTDGQQIITLGAGLLGGVFGAGLILLLFRAGIFLLGAVLGIAGVHIVMAILDMQPSQTAVLIAALSGGVLAIFLEKIMVILATSFLGSWGVVSGVTYYLNRSFDPFDPTALSELGDNQLYRIAIAWFALFIVGFTVQYMTAPRKLVITDESTIEEAQKNADL